jgi:hypothetical protein
MRRWLLLTCIGLLGCPSRPSAPDASDDVVVIADAQPGTDAIARDGATSNDATAPDASGADDAQSAPDATDDANSSADAAATDVAASPDAEPFDASAPGPYIEPAVPYSPEDVTVPPLPTTDAAGLPLNDAGQPILAANSNAEIVLVRPAAVSPLNVLARCGSLVVNCVQPGVRSVDACFASVRQCSTADPTTEAPCCPTACVSAFRTARVGGAGPMRAFDRALFSRPSCVPGVEAMLGAM